MPKHESAPRILQIEDDPASQRLVERVLQTAGMEVCSLADGLEGVAEAIRSRPDLVLVDINIPGLDGYEVALRLRSEAGLNHVPIVAITAEGTRSTSLAVGFDGFIEKPIDVASFPKRIRHYLDGGREKSDAGARELRSETHRIVRRLEEKVRELEAARDRLESARKAREEFYRNISHELMTPLTPMLGSLQMLEEARIGPLTADQRDALRRVRTSAERIRGLLTNLLDISALGVGRVALAAGSFQVRAAFEPLVADVAARCAEKAIRFEHSLPRTSVTFLGDRERIPRVLGHLLDNSIKFTPAGGAVRLDVAIEGGDLVGFVIDNGIGIPGAEQTRIFEPFYQVDGSATRAHGGMGVGLTIARDFVALMGGSLWVESPPRSGTAGDGASRAVAGEPGGGTLFGVRIPPSGAASRGPDAQ